LSSYNRGMSGHSKWSTIKHKKAAVDAKRGNVFTKMANAISVATKTGNSGDPDFNFSLRLAIEKARAVNMPKENIKRAIERGLGQGEGGQLEELTLEAFAAKGVGIVIEAVTDNRNRTIGEIKTILDKGGGTLGEPGSVLYLFERVGVVRYEGKISEEDALELIELGASDWKEDELGGEICADVGREMRVVEYLSKRGYLGVEGGAEYRPITTVKTQQEGLVKKLIETLLEQDDVQEVYANYETV